MSKNKNLIKRSFSDKVFDTINIALLSVMALLVLYPLYFIVIASFSDPDALFLGEVWLLPKNVTFEGYKRIFADSMLWRSYLNTIFYTVSNVVLNLAFTMTAGYALSRKNLFGKKLIVLFMVITMYFDGGIIPTYLVINNLKLINTIWVMIVPMAVAVGNVVLVRAFFTTSLPEPMLEAAAIDGANDLKIFYRIALPMAKPIIAVIAIFVGVGVWNSYFTGLMFLRNRDLYPLQLVLRGILLQSQGTSYSMMADITSWADKQRVYDLLKYGIIIVSTLPIMAIYPFFQKYFTTGVVLGAVKS